MTWLYFYSSIHNVKGTKCHENLTQLSKIMWLITVLSWFNRRAQLIFHVGPGRFGQIFSLNKWNHHIKTAFCIYLRYLCVILKLVWWSEPFKGDKYAKKLKSKNLKNRKVAKNFSQHCILSTDIQVIKLADIDLSKLKWFIKGTVLTWFWPQT